MDFLKNGKIDILQTDFFDFFITKKSNLQQNKPFFCYFVTRFRKIDSLKIDFLTTLLETITQIASTLTDVMTQWSNNFSNKLGYFPTCKW